MIAYSELVDLERSLRSTRVLSIYINGELKDPGQRVVWRTQLGNAAGALRERVAGASHAERMELERCLEVLEGELVAIRAAPHGRGWVGFITADGPRYTETLPVAVPTCAWWGEGARIAPLLRALKELRPAITAVADSRTVRVYRYQGGELERLPTVRARPHLREPYHMGDAPRPGFHPGTRGRTGTEEAERDRRAARERMMAAAAERMAELAGVDGWLIIGGAREAALELHAALPEAVAGRGLVVPELHVRASEAEIVRAAAEGAASLRRRRDRAVVDRIIERVGANGLGVMRLEPTRRALELRAVHELLLTSRFIDEHPAEAEGMVRSAFDQAALVEHVSGEGAERLDRVGGGIGATLRFPLYRPEGTPAAPGA
jgi:hypothetical protein